MAVYLPNRRHAAALAVGVALLMAACSSGSGSTDESAASASSTTTPVSATAAVRRNPNSTISGIITVSADAPVRLGAKAVAGKHTVTIPAPGDAAKRYELPLVGLRAETQYTVTVDQISKPLTFRTGALPEDFPPLRLENDRQRSQPGLTLLSLKQWSAPPAGSPSAIPVRIGYIAAIDDEGYVVWYVRTELGILDAHTESDGNVMFTFDELVLREVDVLGRDVRELAGKIALDVAPTHISGVARATRKAVRVDTDSVHHDASLLPNGHALFLSTELRRLTGPSQCGEQTSKSSYNVIADIVVEADVDTGEVVQTWPLLDVFDPFKRPGHELCTEGPALAPPNYYYTGTDSLRDWTHANSVVLDEEHNELVASSRHLSAIFALRYHADADGPAGEKLWELGQDGTLQLDGEPTSFQHAAEVLPNDEILAYDNGNYHADAPVSGGGGAPYSRAVIYKVDRKAGKAREVWQHIADDPSGSPVFTAFLGDVDLLDNGDILITHGAIADAKGSLTARIIEVDRKSKDIVYDLSVGDATHPWTVYRAERFATLTPSP